MKRDDFPLFVSCSAEVGVDVGGKSRVGAGQLTGTTQETCCSNCSAAQGCRTWVFVPHNDSSTNFSLGSTRSASSHTAGTCWLLSGASEWRNHSNRISGGDLIPHSPAPSPGSKEAGDHYECGPGAYCAMAMAGNLWPRLYSDGASNFFRLQHR